MPVFGSRTARPQWKTFSSRHALWALAAVWLRIYPIEGHVQNFRKLLDLPPHVIPFALTPVGYPAEKSELKCRYDESRVHFDRW